MGFLFVNTAEMSALMGLPYIQQSAYLLGIRPYMDRETFLVGSAKRRISYQALAEILYVEPHQGIKSSGSPSRQQLRRIIYALERAGLIEIQSNEKHLILKCLLADTDISVQNKPDTNPTHQTDINLNIKNDYKSTDYNEPYEIPNTAKNLKADIPHKSKDKFIYLRQKFEKFWDLYPLKQDEKRAFQEFVKLNPNDELLLKMLIALQAQIQNREELELAGGWIPNWKYPANWLAQQCWNDDLFITQTPEVQHATNQNCSRKKSAAVTLAASCKNVSFDFEDSI